MKKISLLLVSFLVFACTSDVKDPSNSVEKKTTVKEDKANIKKSIEQFYSCMKSLNDGGFSDVVYNFVIKGTKETRREYECGENEKCSYIEKSLYLERLIDKGRKLFDDDYLEDRLKNDGVGFDFEYFKGRYVWDINKKEWTKTESDIIEIEFPEYGKKKNNCRIVVDLYEDKDVPFKSNEIDFELNSSTLRVPLKAHALFTVDGVRKAEVTLSDVNYDESTNLTIPTTLTLEMFADPFNSVFTVKRNTSEKFNINYKFNIGNDACGYELDNILELNHSEYGNIKGLEDAKFLKGSFVLNNLKIVYNVDGAKFKNNLLEEHYPKGGRKHTDFKDLDKLTNQQINEPFDVEMYYNGVKIADVEYDKTNNENPIYFIFENGERESSHSYIQDFEQRMRDIFEKFKNLDY